jgi:hypothetical protein
MRRISGCAPFYSRSRLLYRGIILIQRICPSAAYGLVLDVMFLQGLEVGSAEVKRLESLPLSDLRRLRVVANPQSAYQLESKSESNAPIVGLLGYAVGAGSLRNSDIHDFKQQDVGRYRPSR